MLKNKKYSLKLYEIEIISLYEILKNNKPHLARVETELEKILKKKDFKAWSDVIELIERKK